MTEAATATVRDEAAVLAGLVDDVHELLSRARGEHLFAPISAELQRPQAEATVVVVGETKRGKSSLVNALVSRPGVSPVDYDVATGAYVVLRYASTPFARVHLADSPEPRSIALDEVADYATVQGNPGNHKQVRSLELGLDAPVLKAMTLVDTPGVGGLERGHSELTLQALGRGDALLFVADASAPFSGPELTFLSRAAQRIDTVIFALAKIDLYHGWQTIADDDRTVLAQRAPRFAHCPMVPVSSVLAERALALDDPAEATAVRAEAGLQKLQSLLATDVVARAELLRIANTARVIDQVLIGVERTLLTRAAAARGDPALGEALEADQARWTQLSKSGAEWPRRLDVALKRIEIDRREALRRGIADLRQRYLKLIEETDGRELDALPGELIADLGALADRLAEQTAGQLADAVGATLADMDDASELQSVIGQLEDNGFTDNFALAIPGERPSSSQNPLVLLTSFSTGRSLASFVLTAGSTAGLAVSAGPLAPLALAGGAVYTWATIRSQRKAARKAELRTWLATQLSDAQAFLGSDFSRRTLDVQDGLRRTIAEHIEVRKQELSSAIAVHKRALAEGRAERERTVTALRQERERVWALRVRAGRLLTSVRGSRSTP